MEQKIVLKDAWVAPTKKGTGFNAYIKGIDDEFFGKFCKTKPEADKAIAELKEHGEGTPVSIAYEPKEVGGKVFNDWQVYKVIGSAPEPDAGSDGVDSKRAARVNEFLSRIADANRIYELGMGITREDWTQEDKNNVVRIAVNLGWNK